MDATQIARFGDQTFHPIIGHVLNISDEKQNVAGYGGGTVLGYVPKVRSPFISHFQLLIAVL